MVGNKDFSISDEVLPTICQRLFCIPTTNCIKSNRPPRKQQKLNSDFALNVIGLREKWRNKRMSQTLQFALRRHRSQQKINSDFALNVIGLRKKMKKQNDETNFTIFTEAYSPSKNKKSILTLYWTSSASEKHEGTKECAKIYNLHWSVIALQESNKKTCKKLWCLTAFSYISLNACPKFSVYLICENWKQKYCFCSFWILKKSFCIVQLSITMNLQGVAALARTALAARNMMILQTFEAMQIFQTHHCTA